MPCFVIIKQLAKSHIIESLCKHDLTGTACFDPRKIYKKKKIERQKERNIKRTSALYPVSPCSALRDSLLFRGVFIVYIRTTNVNYCSTCALKYPNIICYVI